MNRRTLNAFAAAALVSLSGSALAQSCDEETCVYGGTLRAMFEMLTAAFVDLPGNSTSDVDLAFGLHRVSAVGLTGHTVLSDLEPAPSIAETHALLLDAMATIAAASPDLELAITRADTEALSRAKVAAEHSWELLTAAQNAGGTLPEIGATQDRTTVQSTPVAT